MNSQALQADTVWTVAESPAHRRIEPLDRDGFEHLTEAEAKSLLSSRFSAFIERGWGWKEALMLTVRPDSGRAVPHTGDAS